VLLAFLIGTPLLLLERLAIRRSAYSLRRNGRLLHRVLAVGGPSGISEVVDALRREQYVGYQVVGACVPDEIAVEPARFDVPVLGRVEDTRRLCDEVGADTVLIARGGYDTSDELRRIAWDLEGSSIDLVVVPSLTDVAGPRIHMRPVAGLPLLHLEQPQAGEAAGWGKRAFDLAGSLLALVMLSPLMLAVIVLIKLEDRGPVLFRQPRIGRDGSTFHCLKFRSMFVDADRMERGLREKAGHDGALFKMPDDPRITRVGAFIRRYSVDEVPQLLNVVRGDMSLVGPRPQQAWEVETYTDWEHRRLRVRPGMTGLWQVSGRSQLSFDEAIRLDLYYVDNWSMTADLAIMGKTVRAVLGSAGAY
jgi:exopolysaccharide biosynthesis polyprenyl glycosylphosphotransferase